MSKSTDPDAETPSVPDVETADDEDAECWGLFAVPESYGGTRMHTCRECNKTAASRETLPAKCPRAPADYDPADYTFETSHNE